MKKFEHHIPSAPDWVVVSQLNPHSKRRRAIARLLLPHLVWLWQQVEAATGYAWMSTSYWRDSASHIHGYALDIAPDIAASSRQHYAADNGSDPVLYKRKVLIRKLQQLKHVPVPGEFIYGLFIEPDHIHMHLALPSAERPPGIYIFKWRVPKPAYGDTYVRMKLPAFNFLPLPIAF